MDNNEFLSVKRLKKYFFSEKGFLKTAELPVKAVDGVDITVKKGETVGLVGESGCGKTTIGRCILRLEEPTEGEVYFEGKNILSHDPKTMETLRRDMQIIFQDPYSSLNPRRTVGKIVGEGLVIHERTSSSCRVGMTCCELAKRMQDA